MEITKADKLRTLTKACTRAHKQFDQAAEKDPRRAGEAYKRWMVLKAIRKDIEHGGEQ